MGKVDFAQEAGTAFLPQSCLATTMIFITLDPSGDDNPDIQDFYGRFEFGYGRKIGAFKMLALWRNNLDFNDNRGSIQLDVTYPMSDRYDLLIQYFNGYGDSLIDYNRSQERIGIGFQVKFL